VAVLVIGLTQAGGNNHAPAAKPPASLADAERQLAGAPAPLAALHRQAATIKAGGRKAFDAQLATVKGYPVVVNAWASWCGPCKLEFPVFQRVSTDLGKRVAFLGLNVADNRGDAKAFLSRKPVPYPSFEDGDSRIAQSVGARGGLPITVFYDRKGERTFTHAGGYESVDALRRDIRRYAGA
jgi:thiol-disulfide isomerase/thioredoxin